MIRSAFCFVVLYFLASCAEKHEDLEAKIIVSGGSIDEIYFRKEVFEFSESKPTLSLIDFLDNSKSLESNSWLFLNRGKQHTIIIVGDPTVRLRDGKRYLDLSLYEEFESLLSESLSNILLYSPPCHFNSRNISDGGIKNGLKCWPNMKAGPTSYRAY